MKRVDVNAVIKYSKNKYNYFSISFPYNKFY